jgi:hypothetical protein
VVCEAWEAKSTGDDLTDSKINREVRYYLAVLVW